MVKPSIPKTHFLSKLETKLLHALQVFTNPFEREVYRSLEATPEEGQWLTTMPEATKTKMAQRIRYKFLESQTNHAAQTQPEAHK